MSNKSKPSAVFFRGDNRDGLPVVVTVTVGGNRGTGPCVGISIFDAFIFDHIRETCSDTMEARHKYLEHNKTPDGLRRLVGVVSLETSKEPRSTISAVATHSLTLQPLWKRQELS